MGGGGGGQSPMFMAGQGTQQCTIAALGFSWSPLSFVSDKRCALFGLHARPQYCESSPLYSEPGMLIL